MMTWTTGLALIPLLMCAVMMFGGAALAAMGLRHTTRRSEPQDRRPHDQVPQDRVPADR